MKKRSAQIFEKRQNVLFNFFNVIRVLYTHFQVSTENWKWSGNSGRSITYRLKKDKKAKKVQQLLRINHVKNDKTVKKITKRTKRFK